MDDEFVKRPGATNLIIVAIGLTLFAVINLRSGRIEANDGFGWDGRQYSHMVTGGLRDGTVATQTRPLLPLLTRIPHAAGMAIIPAFQVLNFVYAAVLYFFLCLIFDLYRVATVYKAYFVATVALCIATSTMFAFYPVQIDLGSLAVITASTYMVLTRSGWAAGAAALLAVPTREFGIALALAGFHRELRFGRGVVRPLLTYAPAVGALFLLRQWAAATNLGDRGRDLLTTAGLIGNVDLWRDPAFAAFFFYFTLTLLGGATVLLALRPAWLARAFAGTPELATYSLVIVAAAVVGNADIWRYLVFLLPVLAVVFAAYVNTHQPGLLLLSGALLFTIVTQRPFVQMDMTGYFNDWFPGYVYSTDDATDAFWSAWRTRVVVAVAGVAALGVAQGVQQRSSSRNRI